MRRARLPLAVLAVALTAALGALPAAAQGTVQVTLPAAPPVLTDPFLASFERDLAAGRYPVQVLYSAPSGAPLAVRLRVALDRNARPVLDAESLPFEVGPGLTSLPLGGPDVAFAAPLADLLAGEPDVAEAVRQTGALPEGLYTLRVEAVPEDRAGAFVTSVPAVAVFEVRYAQPPVAFTPADGGIVGVPTPVFGWTPVVAAPGADVQYELLIVPVRRGLSAIEALEGERPWARVTVTGTTVPYTPDAFPPGAVPGEGGDVLPQAFTPGLYAWQVTARDPSGTVAFADGGASEPQTFLYNPAALPGALDLLADLVLEPGVARLVDLRAAVDARRLTVTADGAVATLDGEAVVELVVDGQPTRVAADVAGVELSTLDPLRPTLLAGAVRLRATPAFALGAAADVLEATDVTWAFGEGVALGARLRLPGARRAAATGALRVRPAGLEGRLDASDADGLARVGSGPAVLVVTEARAAFPGGGVALAGRLDLFGGASAGGAACAVPSLRLDGGALAADVACAPGATVALGAGAPLSLDVTTVDGTVRAPLAGGAPAVALRAEATARVALDGGPGCAAPVTLALDADGLSLTDAAPACAGGTLALGVGRAVVNGLVVRALDYRGGRWTVDAGLRGSVEIPALGLATPALDLGLVPSGLQIPAVALARADLPPGLTVAAGPFRLRPTSLDLPALTVPVGGGAGTDAWRFTAGAEVVLPDGLPACLAGRALPVVLTVRDGTVAAAATAVGLDCAVAVGPAAALALTGASAGFAATITPTSVVPAPESGVAVVGSVALGAPLVCEGGPVPLRLTLAVTGPDVLAADVPLDLGRCRVPLGPFRARFTDATLQLRGAATAVGQGGQAARLAGGAALVLGDGQEAVGSLGVDLARGAFDLVRFTLPNPFDVVLPPGDAPVMRFRLPNATLGLDGFAADGRALLVLPDGSTVGSTFDSVRFGLETGLMEAGQIAFDRAIGFEAGLDLATGAATFRAVAADAALAVEPGLRMNMGTVSIVRGLLRTGGTSTGALRAGGVDLGAGVRVDYQAFGLGLQPPGVTQGSATFSYEGLPVATLDATGFHLSPAVLSAAVPDTLYLPTAATAYVPLKDAAGTLLVDVTSLGGGRFRLETPAPLRLHLPALQGADATEPEAFVTFTDVVFDGAAGAVSAGEIAGTFPVLKELDAFGVPLAVRTVVYGERELDGVTTRGLFLEGPARLFGATVGPDDAVRLGLTAAGRLVGRLDVADLPQPIPLVPGGGTAAQVRASRLQGRVDVPLAGGPPADLAVTLDGRFQVVPAGGEPSVEADVSFALDTDGIGLTAFTPVTGIDGADWQAGPAALRLDRLTSLAVEHRWGGATTFRGLLDASLVLHLADPRGDSLHVVLPVRDAEITEAALTIPAQTRTASEQPALSVPPVPLGPLTADVTAFRTGEDVVLPWAGGAVGTDTWSLDLVVRLDSLAERLPELADTEIVLTTVGVEQGTLTATLVPYQFGPDLVLPLGPGADATGFGLRTLSGRLYRTAAGRQGVEVLLTGAVAAGAAFAEPDPACAPSPATLAWATDLGFVGTVSPARLCAAMAFGPATVAFAERDPNAPQDPPSSLTVRIPDRGAPTATFDGVLVGTWPRDAQPDLTTVGRATVDLLTGELTAGYLEFTGPLALGVPLAEPVFDFTVDRVRLTRRDVTVDGAGSLALGQASASVQFAGFALGLATGQVTAGQATVGGGAAFELGLAPVSWAVTSPAAPFTAPTGARLTLSGGFTVTPEGATFDGGGTSQLNVGGQSYTSLDLLFQDLVVALDQGRARVTAGVVDFVQNQARLAWLDAQGFHADALGIALSVLPERLPLPTEAIAYLDLGADAANNPRLLVDLAAGTVATAGGQTVDLVLPGLGASGAPRRLPLAFAVTLDDLGNVASAALDLSGLGPDGVDLAPLLGAPLRLRELAYTPGALGATLALDLPASLDAGQPSAPGRPPLSVTTAVTADGFGDARLALGTYRDAWAPELAQATPLAQVAVPQSGTRIALVGADVELRTDGTSRVRLAGTLTTALFADADGAARPLFLRLDAGSSGAWSGAVQPTTPDARLDLGVFTFEPVALQGGAPFALTVTDAEFAVEAAGVVRQPDLGAGMALTVERLRLSTAAPYAQFAGQQTLPDQSLSLFNDVLQITATDVAASVDLGGAAPVVALTLDGTAAMFGQAGLAVDDLVLRSDGTFGADRAELTVVEDVTVIENAVTLESVKLVYANRRFGLRAAGTLVLPAPVGATSSLALTVDHTGAVTVDGPAFVFDGGYQIGNNPATEFALGAFATFELTGVALDLDPRQPQNTTLYASAALFLDNQTDEEHRILFGRAGSLRADPGLRLSRAGGAVWSVSTSVNPETNPLEFDADFFSLSLSSLSIQTDAVIDGAPVPFAVTLGGRAGLALEAVEGTAGFEGFTVSTRGLESVGRFAGGATFSVIDVVSLSVGDFDRQEADGGGTVPLTLTRRSGGGSSTETRTETLDVRRYLRFGDAGQGQSALQVSLSEGFAGGIDEVLFYETTAGERVLTIAGATLAFSDQAAITASMELVTARSGFSLSVAGSGQFAGQGVAAAGTISTLDDRLRFGVFVAASATIPIVPAIVELNGLGGGFYFRPQRQDFDFVDAALAGMTGGTYHRVGELPPTEGLGFAVLVYAGTSILGTGQNAALSGHLMLTATDQFTTLSVNSYLYGMTGQGGRPLLGADLYVTVQYSPDVNGVSGGVALAAQFGDALDGTAGLDFFAAKRRTAADAAWGITGHFSATVLSVLDGQGGFTAGPDGMLLDLAVDAGGDLGVIAVDAGLEMTVWNMPSRPTPFGAYGAIRVGFDVLGGLATLDARVAGLLVDRRTRYELYLAGSAYVSVLWVFDGTIDGWVAVQTSPASVDWGTGRNAEMDALIAQARRDAEAFQDRAEETRASVDGARADLAASVAAAREVTIPTEVVARAGANLFLYPYEGFRGGPSPLASRCGAVVAAAAREHTTYGTQHLNPSSGTVLGWLRANVLCGGQTATNPFGDAALNAAQPDAPETAAGRAALTAEIDAVGTEAAAVRQRLAAAEAPLGALADQMAAAVESGEPFAVPNPVQSVRPATFAGGLPLTSPRFSLDEAALATAETALARVRAGVAASDARYRAAVEAAAAQVALVDVVLDGSAQIDWGAGVVPASVTQLAGTGQSVTAVADRFTAARTALDRYFAQAVGGYWQLADWTARRAAVLRQGAVQTQIRTAVAWQPSWTSAAQLQRAAQAASTRIQTVYSLAGQPGGGGALAAGFAGALPASGAVPPARQTEFADYGMQLWWQVPTLGLEALGAEAMRAAVELAAERQALADPAVLRHAALTADIDRLYLVKARMLTSVHGLIAQYDSWRTAQGADAPPPLLAGRRAEVEQALRPPTLALLVAQPQSGSGFSGRVRAVWLATHPTGVAETATALQTGVDQNVSVYASRPYASTGALGGTGTSASRVQDLYLARRTAGVQSVRGTLHVRARGTGGRTAVRAVQFDAPVAPGGASSGTVATGPGSDTQAPAAPQLDLPYPWADGAYWTADSVRVRLVARARDTQSGIRDIEVRLGTQPGAGDVADWQPLQGAREVVQPAPGSFFDQITGTVEGLRLRRATPYYVSLRAVDGAGNVGPAMQLQGYAPLRVDPTPPDALTLTVTGSAEGTPAAPPPVRVAPLAPGAGWASPRQATDAAVPGSALATVRWATRDAESGVLDYDLRWDDRPHADPDDAAVQMTTTTPSRDLALPYVLPRYVWVRARNRAGGVTGWAGVGPLRRLDPTPPTVPDARVTAGAAGASVRIAGLSADAQSGVVGYETAVGTAPGTDDLVAWSAVRIPQPATTSGAAPPSRSLVWSLLGVAPGRVYVSTRAVNGQGLVSGAVATEVLVDPTPPPAPSVAAELRVDRRDPVLTVQAETPADPESGLAGTTVRVVQTAPDGTDAELVSDRPAAFGAARPWTLALPPQGAALLVPGATLTVTVTATNGVGATRQGTARVRVPPQYVPPVGPQAPPPRIVIPRF